MRYVVLSGMLFWAGPVLGSEGFLCAGSVGGKIGPTPAGSASKPVAFRGEAQAKQGIAAGPGLHALTIFARFADEGGDLSVPEFAGQLFDPQRPGSVTHFYLEMSRGQFRLTGDVLPRWYVSSRPTAAYLFNEGGVSGLGEFVREILEEVDAEIDLGLYDNDGPDGLPN